jgi:predicted transcriptional regulator
MEMSKPQKPLPTDDTLIDVLDSEWRTQSQIRSRLRHSLATLDLAHALEELVNSGLIDRRTIATKVPKSKGGNYAIRQYRRHTLKERSAGG